MSDEILVEERGPLGLITLNRPGQLNALSLGMIETLSAQLAAWAASGPAVVALRGAGDKAFCAGGDIRAIAGHGRAGWAEALKFFAAEYRLNAAVKAFPKPLIAFMDGVAMGGGAGLAVHARYTVGGPKTLFAMPELAIGLVPDVGASFFLPRMPRRAGLWLGLTGARIGAEDCMALGVADYLTPSERIETVLGELAAADYAENADEPVCEILALNSAAPGAAPIKPHFGEIETAFEAETLEATLAALEAGSDWAQAQAAAIKAGAPSSARLAWRLLTRHAARDVKTALGAEYGVVRWILQHNDFYEGVRARIVDKDDAPAWSPASLAEIADSDVQPAFAPLGADALSFD